MRQAERERDTGFEPPLREAVVDLGSYETIYLGFPIWGMTAPPVIRSFLSRHDLAGKTIVPLITHGGYGTGQSLSVVARLAPKALLREAFTLQMNQEREILQRVTRWLGTVNVRRQARVSAMPSLTPTSRRLKLKHLARGLLLAGGVLLTGALLPPLRAQEKAPAVAQSKNQQTRAQQLMGDIAPKLAELTDNVLFADVWERPGLSKRDRSLITVSALIALNRPDQLRSHLIRARDNGVTQEEVVEAITHLAFYAGWPNAVTAVGVAKEVFQKK